MTPSHGPRRRAAAFRSAALAAVAALTVALGAPAHASGAPDTRSAAAPYRSAVAFGGTAFRTATGFALAAQSAALRVAAAPSPAVAAEGPLVVSLGDSFISGEAGRWQGNSLSGAGDKAGTDRAWDPGTRQSGPRSVYGDSYGNGCHRSDSAEIKSASLTVGGTALAGAQKVNLACSGATSKAVLLPEHGGEPFRGEPSQAEQLRRIATGRDVPLVVVSLGGNDLGFTEIITRCVAEFLKPLGGAPCAADQAAVVARRLPAMRTAVAGALADVTTAMRRAGHRPGSYRLVLQSYPSPIPDAGRVRYPGERYDRFTQGGCPFFDKDLTWAHDELVPAISASLARVAAARGADFLDLSRAFDGREVCADTTVQATRTSPPTARRSEWIRFLTAVPGQGQLQEALHPDYFGQQGLGTCLSLLLRTTGSHACANRPGRGPADMVLS